MRIEEDRRAAMSTAAAPGHRSGRCPISSSRSRSRAQDFGSGRTAAILSASGPSDGATAIVSRTSHPPILHRSSSSAAVKRRNSRGVSWRGGSGRKGSRSSRPRTPRRGACSSRRRAVGGKRARYWERSPGEGASSMSRMPLGATSCSASSSTGPADRPANPSVFPNTTTSDQARRANGGRPALPRILMGTGPRPPTSGQERGTRASISRETSRATLRVRGPPTQGRKRPGPEPTSSTQPSGTA